MNAAITLSPASVSFSTAVFMVFCRVSGDIRTSSFVAKRLMPVYPQNAADRRGIIRRPFGRRRAHDDPLRRPKRPESRLSGAPSTRSATTATRGCGERLLLREGKDCDVDRVVVAGLVAFGALGHASQRERTVDLGSVRRWANRKTRIHGHSVVARQVDAPVAAFSWK